jgi:hypothetical protein
MSNIPPVVPVPETSCHCGPGNSASSAQWTVLCPTREAQVDAAARGLGRDADLDHPLGPGGDLELRVTKNRRPRRDAPRRRRGIVDDLPRRAAGQPVVRERREAVEQHAPVRDRVVDIADVACVVAVVVLLRRVARAGAVVASVVEVVVVLVMIHGVRARCAGSAAVALVADVVFAASL